MCDVLIVQMTILVLECGFCLFVCLFLNYLSTIFWHFGDGSHHKGYKNALGISYWNFIAVLQIVIGIRSISQVLHSSKLISISVILFQVSFTYSQLEIRASVQNCLVVITGGSLFLYLILVPLNIFLWINVY